MQDRHFFLFDNLLIYCKKLLKGRWSVKGKIFTENITVIDVEDGSLRHRGTQLKNVIRLRNDAKQKWWVVVLGVFGGNLTTTVCLQVRAGGEDTGGEGAVAGRLCAGARSSELGEERILVFSLPPPLPFLRSAAKSRLACLSSTRRWTTATSLQVGVGGDHHFSIVRPLSTPSFQPPRPSTIAARW
jgi:hypothetical protein